jgi:transcriptional regulator with XRE-family HTH domain
MITPEQSRAARGWLDWTQGDLAERANVALSTIRDFEKGRRTPIKNNLDAMRQAFEAAGVRMLFSEGGKALGVGLADG